MTEGREGGSLAFISYSHRDADLVTALVRLLKSIGSVFMDTFSLVPGDEWREDLQEGIRKCSVFLLFWCEHAVLSEEIKGEWKVAIGMKKRIVPVLLDITPLPKELATYQWVDLTRILNMHLGAFKAHQDQSRGLRDYLDDDTLRGIDTSLLRASRGQEG